MIILNFGVIFKFKILQRYSRSVQLPHPYRRKIWAQMPVIDQGSTSIPICSDNRSLIYFSILSRIQDYIYNESVQKINLMDQV
jgi:hypothetical protein